jgi:hypothetical protein
MNTGIQDAWNLGWKLALVARGWPTSACSAPTTPSGGRSAGSSSASPTGHSPSPPRRTRWSGPLHVGYRAAGADFDGLERYLARWLPGAADPGA